MIKDKKYWIQKKFILLDQQVVWVFLYPRENICSYKLLVSDCNIS